MTPEALAAIAARNAARTQGKWLGMNMVNIDGSSMTAENIGEYIKNSVKKTAEVQKVERFLFVTIDGDNQPDICHVGNGPMGPHNAAFIAHASEDIPALLAEVSRLSDALAEAEKRITEAACDVVDGYSEFDQPYCCDGRMCGCQGQSVHDMMKHFIRAMVKP